MSLPLRVVVAFAGISATAWLGHEPARAFGPQTRPDFSGQWQIDEGADAPARGRGARGGGARGRGRVGDMGSGWGDTITVTQDQTRLTVEYVYFSRGDLQPPLKFAYPLDGSTTVNRLMMGRGVQTSESTSEWNGDRLVITTRETVTNPETGGPMPTVVLRTLQLESPSSLVVEVTRRGVLGGPDSTTRTVYRKAGASRA